MPWLTSAWTFYGSLVVLLGLRNLAVAVFGPDPTTGKTLLHRLRDGYRRREETRPTVPDIRGNLERLLSSGYDRSALHVTFDNSELFVLFRKYIHAKGDYGIELEFPLAHWSAEYIPALHDYCASHGIAFTVGPDVHDDCQEFHHVDFGNDADAAFRMFEAIVTHVFRIPTDSPYKLKFFGINPFGAAIIDPRQMPPSRAEHADWETERLAHQLAYVFDASVVSLGGQARYFGILGILYSLLWCLLWAVEGLTPNWGSVAFTQFDTMIEPRIFDLICIGLIFIGLLVDRSPSARRLETDQDRHGAAPSRWSRAADSIFPRRVRIPALIAATIASWIA